jgi:hypothetical protein
MLAAPEDLADYRAYRTAEHEGRRLYEAQQYLERHTHGAWAEEVRAAFDREEPEWFEAAKTSRARAREYVIDLPTGPHADAARSLLVLFDEHQADFETLQLLAASRRMEALLDVETARRRRVSEIIRGEVAALLDPPTWGAHLDSLPPTIARAFRGDVPRTWDGGHHAHRQDELFFVLPTPQGSQARVVEVGLQVWLEQAGIAEGLVQGADLFVRWSEAMLVRVLDPGAAEDRALAASTVADVLAGALEASLPAARCAATLKHGEILARACDGWTTSVRMGDARGSEDAVVVRGAAR